MADSSRSIALPDEVAVVNIGLSIFADAVRDQAASVEHVDWRIPADGQLDLVGDLEQLFGPRASDIDRANAEAVRRLDQSVPLLVDVAPAETLVPGLSGRMLLHCGPAIEWTDVCDPLRRSMRAATVAEGWAESIEGADRILADGTVRLRPAYRHDTVMPMASAIGPSTPVFAVDNRDGGTRAFAPINQGPGETAWFGRETPAAIDRLEFLRDVAGPMLREVLHSSGPIDIFALAAQGVQIGDDVHMRTQGTSSLLVRNLLPQIAKLPDFGRLDLAQYLSGNHLFFLNLAMAAAKSAAMWAEQVEGSSIVTMMCRNGTSYGIRLAGSSEVFLGEAPPVAEAMYYPDYGPETSARDIGDSAILELVGLGGAAAAGSPAVAGFLPEGMADAVAMTEQMGSICVAESTRFKLPTRNYRGTPVGVDVRRVVEMDATPKVTTGILHASSGVGQIGAGVATAPIECFRAALRALAAGESRG
ncbi:DUF1116 domain-containing protein [Nocardioides guangzhouensis]|uniref:DUF1116 domain-containing protein n=1 Tax=Nocardioides guangzhouensis TaxID=2497878 RepID=A0A4Q4ZAD9_9ACTN|nr:DUF1116 domain-containing protein [Nocardioides guangzhouensis]RYP84475.1 DUF1116 domain-containing protein [Nocardioides guangzhouensis]